MAKNLIYVFSGTGNSLAAAKKIAGRLDECEIRLMRLEPEPVGARYERIGFVFPCYSAGAPAAVIDYIKKLDLSKSSANYFFAVVTAGDIGANSIPMIFKLLSRKGIVLDFGCDIKTVGNYLALYPMGSRQEEKLRAADEKSEQIADLILKKTKLEKGAPLFRLNPFWAVYYKAAQKIFAAKGKKMRVESSCTGCELCARLCPVGNIRMAKGKPEFGVTQCAQCMACVQWCPTGAVECGKSTVGRSRWRNPEIKAKELY